MSRKDPMKQACGAKHRRPSYFKPSNWLHHNSCSKLVREGGMLVTGVVTVFNPWHKHAPSLDRNRQLGVHHDHVAYLAELIELLCLGDGQVHAAMATATLVD